MMVIRLGFGCGIKEDKGTWRHGDKENKKRWKIGLGLDAGFFIQVSKP